MHAARASVTQREAARLSQGRAGAEIGGEIAHQRPGAADCGKTCQAAGDAEPLMRVLLI
jgi:hypothetical protein